MKKIFYLSFLIIGVMLGTSCSTETGNSELKTDSTEVSVEDFQRVVAVTKAYRDGTICETCKVNCELQMQQNDNNFIVRCDNGVTYQSSVCNGNWTVTDVTNTIRAGLLPTPVPCN